jgi:hypothetical protein
MCGFLCTVALPAGVSDFTPIVPRVQRGEAELEWLSQSPSNRAMQPFHQYLMRWSHADVTATAYAVAYAGSDRWEHAFIVAQLRAVADRWQKGLHLEIRHMQQRMPRV